MTEKMAQTSPELTATAAEIKNDAFASGATDASTPESNYAYSAEPADGRPAIDYSDHFDNLPVESQLAINQVLSYNPDNGATVTYDHDSGEIIHHDQMGSMNVPQELAYLHEQLPEEIVTALQDAQTLEEAIKVYRDNNDPNPMVQMAVIGAIAEKFQTAETADTIDNLVVNIVHHATEDAMSSPESLVESMIYAVDVVSPEAKSEVIDILKSTLQSEENINSEVAEAVNSAIEELPDVDSGSFRQLVEEHAEKNALLDERAMLVKRLQEVDQKIHNVDQSIDQQLTSATKRRRAFSSALGKLRLIS